MVKPLASSRSLALPLTSLRSIRTSLMFNRQISVVNVFQFSDNFSSPAVRTYTVSSNGYFSVQTLYGTVLFYWKRLTTEIIDACKKKYNIIQHRRRFPQDQPAADQLTTPPGHDFCRNNLGSPYTRQNPSPLQAFYNIRISTP